MTFKLAAYVTVFFFGYLLSILIIVTGIIFLVEGKLISQVSFLAPFTPLFGLAGGFFLGAGIFGIVLIMIALIRKEKTVSVEKVKIQSEIQP
jgi:hypothetical protein